MPLGTPQQESLPPTIGYPVPVRDDGTVSLPLIPPVRVEGMTLVQAEERIQKAYTVDRSILPTSRGRVSVGLIRKRTYHVLVLRSDLESAPAAYQPGTVLPEPNKGGRAEVLDLPAYENDVLHALVRTGGLPGTAAKDQVTVLRSAFRDQNELERFMKQFTSPDQRAAAVTDLPAVTKIPLRPRGRGTGADYAGRHHPRQWRRGGG